MQDSIRCSPFLTQSFTVQEKELEGNFLVSPRVMTHMLIVNCVNCIKGT